MAFKYFKTKKNQFIWTDDTHYRIVFEKPKVQAFNQYVLLHDEKDILYYYYTLTIYKKHEYLTKGNWKVFNTVVTHDFPTIRELKYITGYLLHDKDITKNYQRYTLEKPSDDGKPICILSKTLDTGSHIAYCDDIYELTKSYSTYSKKFCYDFSVGVRDELIKICNLTTDDIYLLHTCVKDFIDYSLAEYNRNVTLNSKKYTIADGHLYSYYVNWYDRTISSCVESIFRAGDSLQDLTICEDGIHSKYSTPLYDVKLLDVERDSITVSGTLAGGKHTAMILHPNQIGYIYRSANKSYSEYTPQQIATHLLEGSNSLEKNDYLTLTIDQLFEKYHSYIKSYYSMRGKDDTTIREIIATIKANT